MTKPAGHLDWDPSNPSAISEPSSGKKTTGWQPEEAPPSQFFNWAWQLIDQWQKHLQLSAYDIIVGAHALATHATLAAAVADSAYGANQRALLLDSNADVDTTIVLSKAGWRIYAAPGVTYTKGDAGTCLQISAADVEIHGLRFVGFTTAAVEFLSGGDYGRVLSCNFYNCTAEVLDSAVDGGKKPVVFLNHTEV